MSDKGRRKMRDGESPSDYILRRIDEMFDDLAVELGDIDTGDADSTAGIPFELSTKCTRLKNAWRIIVVSEFCDD